jgi:16S rRNA (adenine1518-N6/adenine1519-N6)-dimethyltransferase
MPFARKRFGQHFLVDRGVIAAILDAIAPRRTDHLVEIGPGRGALTSDLAARLDRLEVIEIDRGLAQALRARHAGSNLVVHEADVLAFDFGALPAPLRVVGNLPYNISTPILFRLADLAARIADVHAMLQSEVVERIVAAPGTSEYGRLSVMLQYRFECQRLFDVAPQAFRPPPRVESALLRMTPRPAAALGARDPRQFALVVQTAFSQRRKMLRNTLRALVAPARLVALGIEPTRRAEELAIDEYVAIANELDAG